MIRDDLITAALKAVYEKMGQLLQGTNNPNIQREMISDAAKLAEGILHGSYLNAYERTPAGHYEPYCKCAVRSVRIIRGPFQQDCLVCATCGTPFNRVPQGE